MKNALILVSGLCWTATYLLIIWRGLADRTYGMPLVALGANLAWETIFSVQRPPAIVTQHVINIVWLCFDLVILYTVVRFGPREFRDVPPPVFYVGLACTLVVSYLGVDLVSREFDHGGPVYAAFGQNLMMSALFLGMLAARRTLAGQSAWIAGLKLVGTAAAVVWIPAGSAFLLFVYVSILAIDFAYLAAVLVISRAVAANLASRESEVDDQSGQYRLSAAADTATVPVARA
jgi:hypothetical protein